MRRANRRGKGGRAKESTHPIIPSGEGSGVTTARRQAGRSPYNSEGIGVGLGAVASMIKKGLVSRHVIVYSRGSSLKTWLMGNG